MKNESSGIVIEVDNDIAKVRTSKHGDCENCGACPGAAASVVNAKNPIGAKPGQHVMFEIEQTNMLKAAFVVYILPIIAILLGVFIGTVLADKIGGNEKTFQIVGGIVLFVLSLLYVKIFDKSTGKKQSMKPVIKRIL
ncbi:sigma-E factor negative regulatory protein RseC [Clostridium algifaecis]|uniref:Sigma-E factor negative regulatory protein RseC n=1 Tax=Clostridium algifaecis TaxID=1472040 RepID=A0ABS4KW25_9CLOT|nr:SoxR reducing system RseC family protein [Clostridium algifaecis]MBP2033716.1 sigma-E factor negative regulatory protein RseC [Clostridium algifaecis]